MGATPLALPGHLSVPSRSPEMRRDFSFLILKVLVSSMAYKFYTLAGYITPHPPSGYSQQLRFISATDKPTVNGRSRI